MTRLITTALITCFTDQVLGDNDPGIASRVVHPPLSSPPPLVHLRRVPSFASPPCDEEVEDTLRRDQQHPSHAHSSHGQPSHAHPSNREPVATRTSAQRTRVLAETRPLSPHRDGNVLDLHHSHDLDPSHDAHDHLDLERDRHLSNHQRRQRWPQDAVVIRPSVTGPQDHRVQLLSHNHHHPHQHHQPLARGYNLGDLGTSVETEVHSDVVDRVGGTTTATSSSAAAVKAAVEGFTNEQYRGEEEMEDEGEDDEEEEEDVDDALCRIERELRRSKHTRGGYSPQQHPPQHTPQHTPPPPPPPPPPPLQHPNKTDP